VSAGRARQLRREAPELLAFLRFHREDFLAGIERGGLDRIDFALLDGPDDAEYTRDALQALASRLAPGAFVILHDWHEEKCRLVRGYVETSDQWVVDTVYGDTPTGLARLRLRAS
jgi:predicted O-methyltransferase YrrM